MKLSANDGKGGPLGTLAGSVSSVQGVLVCLGDGSALSDSWEPSLDNSLEPLLIDVLPLLLLELISLGSSSVSMVDEESGLLSNLPLSSAALFSAFEPVSGTLSLSS